jgi:hypothetical protein
MVEPDPLDETVSKRDWEKLMREWKTYLKHIRENESWQSWVLLVEKEKPAKANFKEALANFAFWKDGPHINETGETEFCEQKQQLLCACAIDILMAFTVVLIYWARVCVRGSSWFIAGGAGAGVCVLVIVSVVVFASGDWDCIPAVTSR